MKQSTKEYWINGIIVFKLFPIKKVLFQLDFESRSRQQINLYILDRPFSMYIIISMYKVILSYSRATDIFWTDNKPDGHLLKILACLFVLVFRIQTICYFVESVQKWNKKD